MDALYLYSFIIPLNVSRAHTITRRLTNCASSISRQYNRNAKTRDDTINRIKKRNGCVLGGVRNMRMKRKKSNKLLLRVYKIYIGCNFDVNDNSLWPDTFRDASFYFHYYMLWKPPRSVLLQDT